MTKQTKKSWLLLALVGGLMLGSCKKESPKPEDENELITTVKLTFTENGTTNAQTFTWKDLDGDGGMAPTIQAITLKSSRTYKVEVAFLDESKTPAEDITQEIKKEADEHLVVFTASPVSLFTYTATDKDSKNLPLGLIGNLTTGVTNVGTLRLQLRHQPPVNGKPTKNGTPMPGSDDVNVIFPMNVIP
ncbi:MAG: hypothetical protein ACK4GN_01905 [Runella sp.]